MPLNGAKYGNGSSGGDVVSTLASIIGPRKQYRALQFTVPSNTGSIFIGGSATEGATTWQKFANGAARTWQVSPGGGDIAAGEQFTLDPTTIYIKGSNAADVMYIAYLT